jgi:hypothetical protein
MTHEQMELMLIEELERVAQSHLLIVQMNLAIEPIALVTGQQGSTSAAELIGSIVPRCFIVFLMPMRTWHPSVRRGARLNSSR